MVNSRSSTGFFVPAQHHPPVRPESNSEKSPGRGGRHRRKLLVANAENFACAKFRGVTQERRLVRLSPVRHRREIGRVCLDHQTTEALCAGCCANVFSRLVSDDSGERAPATTLDELSHLGFALRK